MGLAGRYSNAMPAHSLNPDVRVPRSARTVEPRYHINGNDNRDGARPPKFLRYRSKNTGTGLVFAVDWQVANGTSSEGSLLRRHIKERRCRLTKLTCCIGQGINAMIGETEHRFALTTYSQIGFSR